MQVHYTGFNLIDAKKLKQIEPIGSVSDTLYFFSREDKFVLPIYLTRSEDETLKVYDLISNLINFFRAYVSKIIIYSHNGNSYQAYVQIFSGDEPFEFNTDLNTALTLALKHKIDIFVFKELLYENGIKVTKEMLEKAILDT